jgi:hypothetical protein
MTKLLFDQQAAREHLPVWALDATESWPEDRLSRRAASAYAAAFPDADLVRFPADGVDFWFDTAGIGGTGREPRTVVACSRVPEHITARDMTRQRGFPLPTRLAAAGYERGHLVARAAGGGMDVNLFAQAWQINQGRSVEGKEFRRLERLAAAHPNTVVMTRLIYTDDTAVPTLVHLLVGVPGEPVEQGLFTNSPQPRSPTPPDRLRAGQAFHRTVQTAFVAGLVGAVAEAERPIRLAHGRAGRIDLLVVTTTAAERIAVVIEVKSTDWDQLPLHRTRPNLRAHLRQLQKYLDTVIDAIGKPGGWDSAVGVLLYPRRPRSRHVMDMITRIVDEVALMVVWHDETAWS